MTSTQRIAWAVGGLLLGLGSGIALGESANQHCTSEECACEHALRQNTVEALEDFLRKYPDSMENGKSACAALAVPQLDGTGAPNGIESGRSSRSTASAKG